MAKRPSKTKPSEPRMHSWSVYLPKATPAKLVAIVDAPNAETAIARAIVEENVPENLWRRLMARRPVNHHLPNHDQTIIAKAMTSAIFTKTKSTLRSLSRLSCSLRLGGSGRFVGIIGSPLRLITRTAYRTSSG